MEDSSSPTPHRDSRVLEDGAGAWPLPSAAPSQRWEQGVESRREAPAASPLGKLQERGGGGGGGGGGSPFAIRAHAWAGAAAAGGGRESLVQEALAADYRAQLKQYQAQLAAKEADAERLRLQMGELRALLSAADGARADAFEAAARASAQVAQLESHVATLEQQLRAREQDASLAGKQRAAAEEGAAAAKAQAAAVRKAVAAKAQDWEETWRYYKEQLDQKDARIAGLEETVQRQIADAERKAREWAQREVDLSLSHLANKGSAVELKSQLSVAQDKLEQALRKVKATEAGNVELRQQKAQMLADMRTLEDLLADSDAERRDLHEKYAVLGERMEALVKEEVAVKEAAQMESEAARLAVQEAVRDAESALKERAGLQKRIQELGEALEAEQAGRAKLVDKVQRKLAAAEQEVGFLKTELESKVKQVRALQADMKALHSDADGKLDACEAQMSSLKSRIAVLTRELEQEKKRALQVKEEADSLWQERLKVEAQAQALKYERRIQELEVQYTHGGVLALPRSVAPAAPVGGTVLDYIPRSEHVRVLESRLSAKESDMTVEMNSRINQTEREWQWKLDGKEQEISSLTNRLRQLEDDLHMERQRSASHGHKLSDESKRLQAQCVELQRDLEAAQMEVARLKESLKDARLANAGMDDDQMTASRQVARLKHTLEESHAALREAQLALEKERKHAEGCERELEQNKARAEDAFRKIARLEGEVAELGAALEQRQEVAAALQAENANWSAKLMAHRGWHDEEMEAMRRQLRQEADEKVGPLEAQVSQLSAELREVRQRHERELSEQAVQHAQQVAQLEKQLAAAERCASELKELSTSMTGVRQDDNELLKGHIQDLQIKLKEAHSVRATERRQHQAALGALESQMRSKLALFKSQHKMLKAQVQGELSQACSDCLRDFETGLTTLKEQLASKTAAAAQAQDAAAAQMKRLQCALSKLLALVSEQCTLPQGLDQVLASAAGSADEEAVGKALQQVAEALRQHVKDAAAAAADAVLGPLEELLHKPTGGVAGGEGSRPARSPWGAQKGRPRSGSIRRVSSLFSLSSRKVDSSPSGRRASIQFPDGRQMVVALEELAEEGCLSEEMQERVQVLADRCRVLLSDLAASETQITKLRQKVASYDEALQKAKAESMHAAERAHEAGVAPLRQEVQRLQDRVRELQQQYTKEVEGIGAICKQQLAEAQALAQRAIDQAQAQSRQLAADLQSERQRGEGASAELVRAQGELAVNTQRAASKIELQERELGLLKERIREMERREVQNLEELRALKQKEREAQLGGGFDGSGH